MKTFWVLASFIAGSSVIATHNYTDNNPDKNRSKNSAPVGTVYILIDKSDYELSLYDEKGWYATYPVVFGNSSLSDKKMEGDKNTPEGTFRIASNVFTTNGTVLWRLIIQQKRVGKDLTNENQEERSPVLQKLAEA